MRRGTKWPFILVIFLEGVFNFIESLLAKLNRTKLLIVRKQIHPNQRVKEIAHYSILGKEQKLNKTHNNKTYSFNFNICGSWKLRKGWAN